VPNHLIGWRESPKNAPVTCSVLISENGRNPKRLRRIVPHNSSLLCKREKGDKERNRDDWAMYNSRQSRELGKDLSGGDDADSITCWGKAAVLEDNSPLPRATMGSVSVRITIESPFPESCFSCGRQRLFGFLHGSERRWPKNADLV
jgi:hypothetical protein